MSSFNAPPLKVALFSGPYPVQYSSYVSLRKGDSKASEDIFDHPQPQYKNSYFSDCYNSVLLQTPKTHRFLYDAVVHLVLLLLVLLDDIVRKIPFKLELRVFS